MKWLLIFLILVLILVTGGYLLTTYPGTLTIHWLGYQIKTSMLVFFTVLLILILLLGFILKILATIFHVPAFFKARHKKHTYEKGISSLAEALSALFALDGKQTEHKAHSIRQYLHEINLATFLEAEAAYLQGDMVEAEKRYQSLINSEDYQFLAHQGITRVYLKLGDDQKALQSAIKAKNIYRKSPWVHNTIIEQAIKQENLPLALSELNEMIKLNISPTQQLNNQKSTILVKLAEQESLRGSLKVALNYAQEAYEIAEDKSGSCFIYVDLLRKVKGDKAARKLIEKIWSTSPHPKLAKLYVDVMRPDSELNKLKIVKRLASFAPHHPESLLMIARAAIDAKQVEEARDCLDHLIAVGYQTETVHKLKTELDSFAAP
jgi:HemY protein